MQQKTKKIKSKNMAKKTIKKNSRTKNKSSKFGGFSLRLVSVVAVLSIFGVVATYVGVVNASAVKGDEIRDLERKIATAQELAEKLAVKEAALRSFVTPAEDAQFVVVDASEIKTITIQVDGDFVETVALAQ